ncbi:hypothetical protein HPB50_005271 [Hyalomma asiaticum]|uniref:Uncharacterized protein n=1 Tax=Hyalomma asiaticum TaxID=266040 RepID=A0ACB7SZU4_HYAAI|nr:hypothetical protein HPB50_005271 [Hyalomma asiaticum]
MVVVLYVEAEYPHVVDLGYWSVLDRHANAGTISSIVNSQAAVLYVDIVSPKVRVAETTTPFVVAGLAATSGTVMTLFGLAVPYAGSAARFCISLYASASGPFAGIMILAFLFPWANARPDRMTA